MAENTLDEDQRAIARRQRIADMLMQQGAEPLETNQMAGGYVVPVSPLAGVAKVAQQLSGAYIGRKADERASALSDRKMAVIQQLYAGKESPTLGQYAASGVVTPEQMVQLGTAKMTADAGHIDKMEERKFQTEAQAKQAEQNNAFRSNESQISRDQSYAQQEQMARLQAGLRPEPQPRQDPLVQIMGENGQPTYTPSSQAIGKQPYTAQTLKQEMAAVEADKKKQQAELSSQQVLDQAAILHAHPGRQAATGASSFLSKIPGTSAKGFQANLDTFKAQTFVPMVSALKGMGALSDAEGKKLSDSVGALDPSMPEAEFNKSLQDVTKFLYEKGKAAGLNVQLPDFADIGEKPRISVDISPNTSPADRAALEADIAKEKAKNTKVDGSNDPAYLEYLRSHKK